MLIQNRRYGVIAADAWHQFDECVITDINPSMQGLAVKRTANARGKVIADTQDATSLGYDDEVFDRVFSAMPTADLVLAK